jgi:N-methylhydantoinase A/oxoprolinase/acetone carboxylase beta subunit
VHGAAACHIDMRYAGQEHAVTVPVDLERTTRETLLDAFHAAHERAYTFRLADTPVELVTFRLTATADVARPELTPWGAEGRSGEAAARAARTVDFGEEGRHETRVFDRDLLPPGFAADWPHSAISTRAAAHEKPRMTPWIRSARVGAGPARAARADLEGYARLLYIVFVSCQ